MYNTSYCDGIDYLLNYIELKLLQLLPDEAHFHGLLIFLCFQVNVSGVFLAYIHLLL